MKRKINAKEFMADIRAGLPDVRLMDKYDLSAPAVHALFKKLLESGLMTPRELEHRMPLSERSVSLEVFRCPACNMPQFTRFEECPQCGVIVRKVTPPTAAEASTTKPEESPVPDIKPLDPVSVKDDALPPASAGSPAMEAFASNIGPTPHRAARFEASNEASPASGSSIKISVTIPVDALSELNALGGDLSVHVTEVVRIYLDGWRKSKMT